MSAPFDLQEFYRNQQTLEMHGRAMQYVVQRPHTYQKDRGEVVALLPGFISMLASMALLANELSEEGYTTVSVAFTSIDKDCPADVHYMVESIASGSVRGVPAGPVRLVPHSKGNENAAKGLAGVHGVREIVSGITGINPVGYGGVSWMRAPVSVADELRHRPHSPYVRQVVRDALDYTVTAGRGIYRTIRETCTASVAEETRWLIEQGVPVDVVYGRHDQLVLPPAMLEGARKAGVKRIYAVDAPHAGHNVHFTRPRETGRAVLDAFSAQQAIPHSRAS